MTDNLIKPTIQNLRTFGAEPLTRQLIAAAKERRTVTYGEAKLLLEQEHDFSTIFPAMMGHPAGKAMDLILDVNPEVPLLNVLLVLQDDGMPSEGAGEYMTKYFNENVSLDKNMRDRSPEKWRSFFERAAADVYRYTDWEGIYKRVYGRDYEPDARTARRKAGTDGSEKDGLLRGRSGEGPNHKALRIWVRENPGVLLPKLTILRAETEVDLLSGDRVDAIYYATNRTVAIEVKSRDSNDADMLRGIYQCVKYRAVLCAMDARSAPVVEGILVTETALPGYLQQLARRFDIRHIEVPTQRG